MNPFVNPNQRGFDLPPGCKDLTDLLPKSSAGTSRDHIETTVKRGKLKDISTYLDRLFASQADNKMLVVFFRPKRVGLSVHHRGGGYTLYVHFKPVEHFSLDALEQIHGNPPPPPIAQLPDGARMITVPLPNNAAAAAELVIALMPATLDIKDDDELDYVYYTVTAPAKYE